MRRQWAVRKARAHDGRGAQLAGARGEAAFDSRRRDGHGTGVPSPGDVRSGVEIRARGSPPSFVSPSCGVVFAFSHSRSSSLPMWPAGLSVREAIDRSRSRTLHAAGIGVREPEAHRTAPRVLPFLYLADLAEPTMSMRAWSLSKRKINDACWV